MEQGKFYSIPIIDEKVVRKTDPEVSLENVVRGIVPDVDMEESIRQHIHMMLVTMPTTLKIDPKFGCILNKFNFHTPNRRRGGKKLEDRIKDQVRKNMDYLLKTFEPRLKDAKTQVLLHVPNPEDKKHPKPIKEGRVVLEIHIEGKLLGRRIFQHKELRPIL